MPSTQPTSLIGNYSLGYVFLAFLSPEAQKQITNLLQTLSQELPDILWPMPVEQLHTTLCEIIQPKNYLQDKQSLYDAHQSEYEDALNQIVSNIPKFTITFDTIEASPQAIIVRASDSSAFNSIRNQLTANIQLPQETRTPPDITHSTIARYTKEVDLERIQKVIARHTVKIDQEISEFKLLKTLVQPLNKYEVVKSYPLIGQ